MSNHSSETTVDHVLSAIRLAMETGADDKSKAALIDCLLNYVPVADPAYEPHRLLSQAIEDTGAKWVIA